MDITNHPADLSEPVGSLENPGSKIKTEFNSDFLAHERGDVIENESQDTAVNNEKINPTEDNTETLKTTDNTKTTSLTDTENTAENLELANKSEHNEIIKATDEAETTKNETAVNTDRIENIDTGKRENEDSAGNMKEEEEEKEEEWLDVLGSGQLKKKILKRAENSYRPQRSNIVEINIEGQLPDGTIVDKKSNLTLQIGDAEHIQALDLALPLMDVGEVALLDVSPRFAYGSLGCEPDVPPNTKIMYTVELLSAKEESEVETLPAEKRKEIGCRKRERGNYWYTRQEHSLAIQCYRRALDFLDEIEGGVTLPTSDSDENKEDDEKLKDLLEERLKVYNNLAAAQMKIKAFETALKSVESVLRCQPDNVKALYRKGKILSEKGEHSQAVAALRQASRLEPDNRMIRQELLQMLSLHREDTKNEKDLYKKMLGQDKRPEDTPPRNNKGIIKTIMSAQFQFPWSIVFGTLAALVAGVVAYRYKFI